LSTIVDNKTIELRGQFLDYLFGTNKGFLCIASANKNKSNFSQRFFEWPDHRGEAISYIESIHENQNVWFATTLFSIPERRKESALQGTFAWAEFDGTPIDSINPPPTCLVESSPGRYHAYWRISGDPIPPDIAEDYSKRLAYSIPGADVTGWDLTQLLRIPWTFNHKYNPEAKVKLIAIEGSTSIDVLEALPAVTANKTGEADTEPVPGLPDDLPAVENVLYRHKIAGNLDEEFTRLYTTTPEKNADWSRILWRFIHKCFTIGMTQEETYVISMAAACNKYQRDNRPLSYLWREVLKASNEQGKYEIMINTGKVELLSMPHLVDFDEFEEDAFIHDYKEWANQATDAPEQYHELTCFIALSAVVCAGLYLKVEWGEIIPNLWGLVLGESTLTRKTTAMRMAMDMLKDVDDSLLLASDGSAEGLLTGLTIRPKRVSIFYKDEVSGFFDAINRKDYLAGLPETLTQLYDVPKVYTRLLRKETITISEPYFIFFGGGIRDKVYSLINDEYILSGFLPRFLVVSGENDLSRLRRTGPPTEVSTERKDNIIRSLADLRDRYNTTVEEYIVGQKVEVAARLEAKLTPDAWNYYGDLEDKLTRAGSDSDMSMLALPTFSRLSFSLLKMALLVAASRREPDSANRLTVEVRDVKQAAFYIQKWGNYSVDLLVNAGRSTTEKIVSRGLSLIRRKEGITRAEFMQRLHLSAREAKDLIDTMVQRGLVDIKQSGRGYRLYSL
jgi:hypothetical protein